MFKRKKTGKSGNSKEHSYDAAPSNDSVKKAENEPVAMEKSAVNSKGIAQGGIASPAVSPTAMSSSQETQEEVRELLKKNERMAFEMKRMEEAMRQIASKVNISEEDIENMDIIDISSKIIKFVAAVRIPSAEPINTKAADSVLIEEVFDELDEHERKYQDQHTMDSITGQPSKDDDFADDVPPKKIEFWITLEQKIKEGDIAFVKKLISTKELKMDETNSSGQNLLMLSAIHGQYELVATAINLGTDLDKMDTTSEKMTALKYAHQKGFLDIEELLQMNLLKTELGRRIEEVSGAIVRTNGATRGFYQTLDEIFQDDGDQKQDALGGAKRIPMSNAYLSLMAKGLKKEVLEVILKVCVQSIERRAAYSNDVLHIAYWFEITKKKVKPTQTVLFKAIETTVKEILADTTNKRDWFWMQSYLLSSPIWYEKQDPDDAKSGRLWDLMFEWVDTETKKQSAILSEPMRNIEKSDEKQWEKLITYDIPSKYEVARQDVIQRGLRAEHSIDELIQRVSLSASFNPIAHHNLQQYLTKLVMVGHEYDDWFQRDIQRMFSVDTETMENKELKLLYQRGPVKRLDRCYAKCQSDYRDEQFPTAAHVLDIIRCSLTFDDVESMLKGMDLFKERIESGQFCVKDVVRVKNGFKLEYSHDKATYTDIKFNVMVSVDDKDHDIIAEVQFLIQQMLEYKKIAHSLYSIERTSEFVENMTKVLPIKTDQLKQLFIQSAKNNLKGFTDLMVTYGLESKQLLKLNQRRQSILTPICAKNSSRILSYLMKVVSKDSIRDKLVFQDAGGSYPLRQAVEKNHFNGVLKYIMERDQLNLANYKDSTKRHITHWCWESKSGQSALLILRTMKSDKDRVKLVDRSISVADVLKTGYAKLLEYILKIMNSEKDKLQRMLEEAHSDSKNDLKRKKRKLLSKLNIKEKWLAVGDNENDGRWSNFHTACRSKALDGGSVDCVRALEKFYDSEEGKQQLWKKNDFRLQTPLFNAVYKGNYNIAQWMLSEMSDEDKITFFTTSNTKAKYPIPALLAQSVTKGHLQTLAKVLDSALSVTGLPWSTSALGEIFLFCAEHNQVETATFLLDSLSSDEVRGSTIAYRRRTDLETSLHLAAAENNLHFVRFLLNEIGPDHKMLIDTNRKGENALMKSASVSALRITKRILEKVKNDNPEFLDKMLRQKSDQKQTALRYAIKSPNHNSRKCAKMIIKYHSDKFSISNTLLSYLEIGDTAMAQKLWSKIQNDSKQRKRVIEAQDAEGYNCFLIAGRNGDHQSLQWLLSLNDEKEDEAAEDERNVMRKHKKTGETPLLICVSNDVRRKVDGQKELTDEEKRSYFKCVKVLISNVSDKNKDNMVKERDQYKFDSIAWCCRNGNVETAKYLLNQMSGTLRKDLMAHNQKGHNYFIDAIRGEELELIRLIHAEYEKATHQHNEVLGLKEKLAALEAQKALMQEHGGTKKAAEAKEKEHTLTEEVEKAKRSLFRKIERELLRETQALRQAFTSGVMDVAEWILNDLIDDSKKRMDYLNETITDCKSGRKTEERAQEIINKILERDLKLIHDRKGIDKVRNIFQFLMKHDDINGISIILKKLKNDEKTKRMWFRTVQCLKYAADRRPKLLGELLKYLGEYYQPLLDQNVLISAITKHSEEVVSLLFKHVQDSKTKDQMIETRNIKKNALISCVEQNDSRLMSLVCHNHSKIEPILGDSFRSCLKSGNVESVKFLLDESQDKSALLNGADEYGRTALMFSLQSGSPKCLQLIADELEADSQTKQLETESTDEKRDEPMETESDDTMAAVHKMYDMTDSKGDNILHYLFSDPGRSANDKQLDVLKETLSSDRLRWLLEQRNLCDEHPLHRMNPSTYISILERVLDLYDDPLAKFKGIASYWRRSKFGHSEYDPYAPKSRRIREFFGEQLVECLDAVDFEKVDMLLLKETFRCTLSWKRPAIQQMILNKISDEKVPELLTSENLYCCDPIIFDLIRVDDTKIAEVVLPEIIKVNPRMLLALNGKRRSALEFSLSTDRFNIMEQVFDSIEDESFLRQYIMMDYGAFKQIYQFRKMTKLVQSKIPDQNLASAVFAAVEFDEDMAFTESLLERVSKEKQHDLLRSLSSRNWTVFAKAAKFSNRLVMEFMMDSVIRSDSDDNVFFYTVPDYAFRTPLGQLADDTVNMDILERALESLKPEMRLQQLLWEETGIGNAWGGSIVSRSRSRAFQEKLAKMVMTELRNMKGSISEITKSLRQCWDHQSHCEEIGILDQLFNHAMSIKDTDYLKLILAKTPEELTYKLLVNYEGGWKYNRIRDVMMDKSNQKKSQLMLELLLNHVENERVADALRDVDNPQQYPITMLQMICDMGDTNKFRAIQSIYEKAKIPIENDLFAIDHQGGSLLHRAMAKVCDIPQHIFKAMSSDEMRMKMINRRRRSDGKCLLDIAESATNKRLLKTVISGIIKNVEKTKMEYTEFIAYFQWLIKEKELDSIKELMAVFGDKDAISNFVSAQTVSKRNAFHIACANMRKKVLRWLLPMIKDEDLRALLMAKDNAGNAPLRYGSKFCRLFVLEHLRERNQQLLKDLILDSNALLIFDCLSSADDLTAIFKYCDDDVLSDELIVQLSFGVEWSTNGDPIRELIVDTVNAKVASEQLVGPESRSNPQLDLPDEAGGLTKSLSGHHMEYVDPFLGHTSLPIEEPETGDSSLALCLMADNRKLFDAIMAKLEVEITLSNYLMEYTNFRGCTLLHMAAARTTKRNEYCTIILKKCLTQQNKNRLLYARDIGGNNIMHLVAIHASHYSPNQNRNLWNLMRESLGKKNNATKSIRLLLEYNEQNRTAMSLFVENWKSFAGGFDLFKELVMNTEQKTLTKYDIPMYARILGITLFNMKSTTEIMEILRFIVGRFSKKLRPKLLNFSDRGNGYMNLLDGVTIYVDSTDLRRFLILDLLPIIDDNDMFVKLDKHGKSPIHHLISEDKESALRMLYQFDEKQIPEVLMSVDTNFEAVISGGGSDTISQFMHKLDIGALLKLFLETGDNRLFSHFQELSAKSPEMMTKLLLCQSPLDIRAHDGTTFSIKLLQSDIKAEFNWITFNISRLEREHIVRVLNLTDNMGNTALLKIGKETLSGEAFEKWKELLALCPDEEMKRDYIVRQNYLGVCAFDNASSRICVMKTSDGERSLFGHNWRPGYRLQRAANRCIESRQWVVWAKRFLRTMKANIADKEVEVLVPLFYVAALKYDVTFAELILKRIDTAKEKNAETFLTTTAMREQATVFHFAANNKKTAIMELLIGYAKRANLDLFKLLSMKSLDGTDDTPLMVAVKNGRYRIIKYLLSVVPEKATKLILLTTEYTAKLTVNNFFKRDEHVIERNAVIWALEMYSKQGKHQRDLSLLKLLMAGCRDFKQLMNLFHYSNALNESIYHYSLTKEVCLYFEEELGVEFSIKMWGAQDSGGATPLMRAMTLYEHDHSMMLSDGGQEMAKRETKNEQRTNDEAVEFLQWILDKCCINDGQRLSLIYRTADDGENVLDKTSGAVRRFLIEKVESMLRD